VVVGTLSFHHRWVSNDVNSQRYHHRLAISIASRLATQIPSSIPDLPDRRSAYPQISRSRLAGCSHPHLYRSPRRSRTYIRGYRITQSSLYLAPSSYQLINHHPQNTTTYETRAAGLHPSYFTAAWRKLVLLVRLSFLVGGVSRGLDTFLERNLVWAPRVTTPNGIPLELLGRRVKATAK